MTYESEGSSSVEKSGRRNFKNVKKQKHLLQTPKLPKKVTKKTEASEEDRNQKKKKFTKYKKLTANSDDDVDKYLDTTPEEDDCRIIDNVVDNLETDTDFQENSGLGTMQKIKEAHEQLEESILVMDTSESKRSLIKLTNRKADENMPLKRTGSKGRDKWV